MKIKIEEWDDQFYFNIQPESVEDAATLIRIGMNCRKAPAEVLTQAFSDKSMCTNIYLPKVKASTCVVRGNVRGKT